MTGNNIWVSIKDMENDYGKSGKKKRKRDNEPIHTWKKRSIFFELPYWKVIVIDYFDISYLFIYLFIFLSF